MEISIMDVIGPLMIGPSSSHTAGAVRLGWTARALCRESFDRVSFGLHGSFARTYRGHGTDLALLAGVIGMQPDDERIRDAADIAASKGLTFTFYETELDHVHENAVKIELFRGDVCLLSMTGSSVGGGRIMVNTLNGVRIDLNTELPAMIIRHRDVRGMIRNIAAVLADEQMNIGTLRLSRDSRGEMALTILETDEYISQRAAGRVRELSDVLDVMVVQREQEGEQDVL